MERLRLKRLFGLVPWERRGSRLVAVLVTETRSISRRTRSAPRLAPLASSQTAFPMEPIALPEVNIQGHGERLNEGAGRYDTTKKRRRTKGVSRIGLPAVAGAENAQSGAGRYNNL